MVKGDSLASPSSSRSVTKTVAKGGKLSPRCCDDVGSISNLSRILARSGKVRENEI